jgi:hypothetical protein
VLYGYALWELTLNRIGHPINIKGWSLIAIAMLGEEEKTCISSEAFNISERTNGQFVPPSQRRQDLN